MAYLLALNPETFDIVKRNNILLFHGTNSNALYSILHHGIDSVNGLENKNIPVLTGEKWSRTNGKRDFISFTDDLNIALNYASIGSSIKSQSQESFGIIFGLSLDDIKQFCPRIIHSDLPEIGFINKIPVEAIKLLAVPSSKLEFVRKLAENTPINIAPIDIFERFYYMDDFFDTIHFFPEKFQQIAENRTTLYSTKTFKSDEVQSLANARKKSGILHFFNSFINKLTQKGRDNYEHDNTKS